MLEQINWDIVSAISNIVLSALTFIGLMITLYFSVRNTFYKLELAHDVSRGHWKMKVINKRNIPVNLMIYGFAYKNNQNRYISISVEYPLRNNSKLEWNDAFRHSLTESEMSELLLSQKFKEGDKVQVYACAKTQDGKMYANKIKKLWLRKMK
ncbi:hypothetical protein [Sporosarcina sp. NPDC096371]|uniref:hypothetical protein n=1 Tax=Sporosarcina sp. NPDC096371 TaxID=3364530 RepID=UPI0038209B47